MPYIINKTNGQQLTIVQDASVDQTTDLTFVGRNYAGYGEIQNENVLKLLENFSNSTPPASPILGQLWYNTSNNSLNVCYAEASGTVAAKFKSLSKLNAGNTAPAEADQGQFWYDLINGQLNIWSGSEYITIGPEIGANIKAKWRGDFEYNALTAIPVFNIKAVLGSDDEVVAIVSAETYNMTNDYVDADSPTYPSYIEPVGANPGFTKIVKGITLQGAVTTTTSGITYGSSRNEVTGLSTSSFFWGTAGEALHALHANVADAASGISAETTNTNLRMWVPFINTTTNLAYKSSGITYNPADRVLYTIASAARYADLAERYEADAVYESGTVLIIGGKKEVTITDKYADTRVAGVVSKNPAYMMNSEAGSDETHPYIALKGRVPCKVVGSINKGDLLVTSTYPGYAASASSPDVGTIIGKALGTQSEGFGVIEVLVV
jgi:hypothetical protein